MSGPVGRALTLLVGATILTMSTACSSSTVGGGTPGATAGSGSPTSAALNAPSSSDPVGESGSPGTGAATTAPAVTPPAVTPPSGNAAGGPQCSTGQISVAAAAAPESSGAGHNAVLLRFTNTSTTSCVLSGYPGVDGVNSAGTSVAHASRTLDGYLAGCGCSTLPAVDLTPGAVAGAQVEGYVDANPCLPFAALLVTPPNTAASTKVAMSPYSCGFTVHPVVSNPTGSGSPMSPDPATLNSADLAAARNRWKQGDSADAASQGQYWLDAAYDLESAIETGEPDPGYAGAESQLQALAAFPDTDVTSAQKAEIQADIAALNNFFGTPGLYS